LAPPLTLRQAVDAALAGNPALQSFAFELRAQDARAQQAALRPAPSVSFEIENVLGTGATRGTGAAESTFALSQVLELGGKRQARTGAAAAARGVFETERQARQLDVLAEVTRRFIVVAARQEELKLGGHAVELAQRAVDGSERRVNAARSPHAELDRARIALDRAKLAQRSSAVALDAARKQLAATWGDTDAGIDGRPIGEIEADLFQLPAVTSYAELTDRLESSPDFLAFASEARLRDAELRLATTLRRPDITLGGGMRQFQANDDRALVASVSVPLFGRSRAESFIAEAQVRREQVAADSRAARVKAEATLYELHRQLERAVAEATALKTDILPRTEEALGETEYAYSRGRYGYLELVDAQREALAVQAALIEAAAGAHALKVEIERLTNAPLTNTGARP
jgi:cobalt-zinc-cadmium efflux system outer membrane protein